MARTDEDSPQSARSILVAMSGGVDSSVAAFLLREAGWDVTGVFMRTGAHAEGNTKSCCSLEDGRDARRVAELLDVPFYALNFEAEFGALEAGEIFVAAERFNNHLSVASEPPPDCVGIFVPRFDSGIASICGQEQTDRELVVFAPASEIEIELLYNPGHGLEERLLMEAFAH